MRRTPRALFVLQALLQTLFWTATPAAPPVNPTEDGARAEGRSDIDSILNRRPSWTWPYSVGPVYGSVPARQEDGPGIFRTEVGTFDLRLGTPPFPEELQRRPGLREQGVQYFVLAADPEGRAFESLRERIVIAGGALVAESGNSTYLVRLSQEAHSSIRNHPGVVALEPYHPAFKLSPYIGRIPLLDPVRAASDVLTLHVAVFPGEDAASVAAAIRGLGGNVLGIARDMVRAEIHRSQLAELASIEAVRMVEEESPILPWGEETTTVLQTGVFQGGTKPYHGAGINGGGEHGTCSASAAIPCQGDGDCPGVETCVGSGSPEVLMLLDSGIQLDAGDLSDTRTSPGAPGPAHRKVRVYQSTSQFTGGIAGEGDDRGCDDPGSGGSTHGHVVASVALGNATQVPLGYGPGWAKLDSRGIARPLDGVAPRAVLVSYDAHITPLSGVCTSPLNNSLAVGDTYTGEGTLGSLEVAYHTHGARTFNFSWGSVGNPAYGTNATRIDSFLSNPAHTDAMLFLAAGNSGRDMDLDSVPDPGSISDPATAKNAVVVGASGNVTEPFNDANEQDRFGNSSVGPANTASQRVAPILMAPGVDFGAIGGNLGFDAEYACRSADNDQAGSVECDLVQGQNGTSFSSAAAAGAGMLVRDYFRQGFYPDGTRSNPGNASDVVTALSGAAVKATLIASADWMDDSAPGAPSTGHGGNLFASYRFNNEQGYGRIQLNNVLPLQSYSPTPTGLLLADGGIGGGRLDIAGLSGDVDTGLAETDTGTFTVCDDAQELRVALVWIDASGNVLNRNLDLELRSPSGKTYFGNYFTDDDNRNRVIDAGEDCPNAHLTGSTTSLDASPSSLETCANSDRDNQNPTEAIFLSPDARLDGTVLNADKQTEAGTWTILVRTGAGSTAAVQRYAVVVAGGVCLGSSVLLDQGSYVCNDSAVVVVDEKDEASDPEAGLTDAEVAGRTIVEVVDPGPDRTPGTADDLIVDREDATSGLIFTHSGLRFASAALALTDGAAATEHSGTLDVRDGQRIRARYLDESDGVSDPNKVRLGFASMRCGVYASIGGVLFGQFGRDQSQLVEGGCERDARGLFTFGFPDRYMDSGETIGFRVAFQSAELEDLIDVVASLRCVLADADSPEGCRPGTSDCPDPDRRNNPPCGSLLTILDSPKTIGDLPAAQVATPGFSIRMGTIAGTPEVDMILGVSARKSGRPAETLFVLRNTLNVDEESYFYSTDFPAGGTEVRDWPALSVGSSPSNEVLDNPTSNAGDFDSDYRFDTMQFSSLQATGRNLSLSGPWNFESGKQGFTVGLNNTTTGWFTETIANWGEDKNFNGVLDYFCTGSLTTACPGEFPLNLCGRCSLSTATICTDNLDCGPNGSCAVSTALGTCFSDEDRDPQNGFLDDNRSAAGGCGWQTNGTTNNPNQPGGVWHTGRIGSAGVSPCLVSGSAAGACQDYETLQGTSNLKIEYEILLSPEVQKVNQCTTDLGPLPASCGGRFDTDTKKVFQVEFTGWAWNMATDLKDRFASLRWELDTDTRSLAPIDLINDSIVLNALGGAQGPVSNGNSPLTDFFQVFAPFSTTSGGASVNGSVGRNRVGRNPCYFEVNPLIGPFHPADPLDDDLDNDSDGQVDEYVEPNGPIRNLDTTTIGNTPADMRYSTLEDIYVPAAEERKTAATGDRK